MADAHILVAGFDGQVSRALRADAIGNFTADGDTIATVIAVAGTRFISLVAGV
ncbi:hypothetical protein [Phreatobacter stygius]|uniref:hypothetical protein n=1 Tax=Phreatobacter stygius TaxID=1940610 RepID=UPI001476865D|nr:hypothetical protein [Phreatobacter stygius]